MEDIHRAIIVPYTSSNIISFKINSFDIFVILNSLIRCFPDLGDKTEKIERRYREIKRQLSEQQAKIEANGKLMATLNAKITKE